LAIAAKKLPDRLTLYSARQAGLIDSFVNQEEARGIGPINRANFDLLTETVVKARQSEYQTSRSSSGENSSGKRTRRGSGPDASR
jgi:hypothetical protein